MFDSIIKIVTNLDYSLHWGAIIPGAMMIVLLELCLSADNCVALNENTSEYDVATQKKLVVWTLITGSPLNLLFVILVMILKGFPSLAMPTDLVLAGLLGYVCFKTFPEIFADKDHDGGVDSGTETLSAKQFAMKVFQLNLISIPFLLDSVPLASTVSSSIVAISIGIVVNRLILIPSASWIVDTLNKYRGVSFGVMMFIAFCALHDGITPISFWTTGYELPELGIFSELGALIGFTLFGCFTFGKVYRFINPSVGDDIESESVSLNVEAKI